LKNWFANKYGISPGEVDCMTQREVEGFKILENARDKKAEVEKIKQQHLQNIRGR